MTLKEAAANSLLAFVAATCVVLIVRALERPQPLAPGPAAQPGAQSPGPGASPTAAMVDGVRVYYLHGNIRCPTCRTIEAYTKEAVETAFAEELRSGKIAWEVVNYDRPENRHYQTDYEVVAPTVVLVKWREGQPVDWRNLNEVWEYVNDKPAFLAFVQGRLREFQGRPAGGAGAHRDAKGTPAFGP